MPVDADACAVEVAAIRQAAGTIQARDHQMPQVLPRSPDLPPAARHDRRSRPRFSEPETSCPIDLRSLRVSTPWPSRSSAVQDRADQARGPWHTAEQVEVASLEYVDWFNHRRHYETCGDIPPAELEATDYSRHTSLAEAGGLNKTNLRTRPTDSRDGRESLWSQDRQRGLRVLALAQGRSA